MTSAADIAARFLVQRESFKLDVDVTIPMRGITGIFGVSGAGKTSFLRCIAGLERPDSGRLIVNGETWYDKVTSRDVHRRNVGYVFQEPRLFPHLDVRRNLEYGLRRSGERVTGIDDTVELLGLGSMLGRAVTKLSGGEAQRVAIARALLRGPTLLLMDEPLASLDRVRRDEILPYLDRLHLQRKVPVMYVSHSIDEISRLCDSLLVMEEGRVVASGTLQEVLLRTDIPLLGGDAAGAVIDSRVVEYDSNFDLTRVTFSGGEFWLPGRHEQNASLRLRIRAGDVSLCRERPRGTTILNVLPATIERIDIGHSSSGLVTLRIGDARILARITRRSLSDLNLEDGAEVYAQVKSVAVRNSPVTTEELQNGRR